ncbi:MAG: YkgJ family cysteine cluster protein [Bacteroidetes bacterium]|nr:YkgJ family cysteine cluster protein [Bacteroidota bacterium]
MPSPLIETWKQRKPKTEAENLEIIKRLKRKQGKQLDVLADEVHDDVFKKIDCLECAGCCTGIPPIVTRADVTRIAKDFGMRPADFQDKYLMVDEDGDTVMKTTPCPFLESDNKCLIYDIRPRACRQYPHTNYLDFSKNMRLHAPNANICPAVFHILREIERRLDK